MLQRRRGHHLRARTRLFTDEGEHWFAEPSFSSWDGPDEDRCRSHLRDARRRRSHRHDAVPRREDHCAGVRAARRHQLEPYQHSGRLRCPQRRPRLGGRMSRKSNRKPCGRSGASYRRLVVGSIPDSRTHPFSVAVETLASCWERINAHTRVTTVSTRTAESVMDRLPHLRFASSVPGVSFQCEPPLGCVIAKPMAPKACRDRSTTYARSDQNTYMINRLPVEREAFMSIRLHDRVEDL